MTTSRLEIVVQGSDDGANWQDYAFRYKPGDPRRAPPVVAPHQPRLDWQMWFAALSNWHSSPWFANFMVRLLEGSPPVVGLLARNPFPAKPPRYVRAGLFSYEFTSGAERARTGNLVAARAPRPVLSRHLPGRRAGALAGLGELTWANIPK